MNDTLGVGFLERLGNLAGYRQGLFERERAGTQTLGKGRPSTSSMTSVRTPSIHPASPSLPPTSYGPRFVPVVMVTGRDYGPAARHLPRFADR